MNSQNQKVLFITGVSSGIGFATADFYLKAGWFVIGTYRKTKDGEYFKNNFSKNFLGIEVDLTDYAKVDQIPETLKQNNVSHVDALVNNAGVALAGPAEYQSFTEFQNIININVIAVFKVTQIILPLLKKSKIGARIVNISSVSGKNGTPFLGGYCASKHAIEGFSESLRRELNLYGMKVSIVAPGSIKTPIWGKGFDAVARAFDSTEYKDSFRKFLAFASSEVDHALPVETVVYDINHALTNASPKLRYAPVPRKFQNWYLPKLFPLKIYDYLTCKALDLNKK
ncbi:MAG: SDR family NAD(P)-dependent oxidoreductase [Pseudobdellovibrio sp.]|nr:SDR family NAD(P)-dependent oxidoreductase [Pseudobdellovibrio sp.]